MPLDPGLYFTPLESVAYPAFQASSLAGNKAPQLFPGPRQVPQYHSMASSLVAKYKRIVDGALSTKHIP